MNIIDIYTEEDMFPREIAQYEERDYGVLFYSERNRDSYDSNHAVIYKNRISNLKDVLVDIVLFYREKGLKPIIYQSISDNGYFEKNKPVLEEYGFELRTETQNYMILCEDNVISPNENIHIRKESVWKEEFGVEIFEKADEPWEIDVIKQALKNKNTLFFVAYYDDRPVGMTHCHVTNGICRVDYLLVAKDCRNMGVARTIINSFVEYCMENGIANCYLWPDGETAEKIYYEAGFRTVETKQAGRAVYKDIER